MYVGEPAGRWQPTFFPPGDRGRQSGGGDVGGSIIMHVGEKYRASSINGLRGDLGGDRPLSPWEWLRTAYRVRRCLSEATAVDVMFES